MVRWLMRPTCGELISVRALTSNSQYGGPDETATVILQFASGATAEVLSSVTFRAPRLVEVYGTGGTIIANDTLGPRGAGSIKIDGEPLAFSVVDPYESELANFVSSIQSGCTPAVDVHEGLANVALLEQISTNQGS
jgi:predicted dehydrogenase